jgi:hypothetical protein
MDNLTEDQRHIIESFWNSPIDYEDKHIKKDSSPFLVMLETPMSKLHFLFTMLNISMLLVVEEGVIKGMVSKLEFI